MRIIQVASELAPIAKVGGLGDVVFGLSRELLRLGHQVEIIIPKYDIIDTDKIENLTCTQENSPCVFEEKTYFNTIWNGKVNSLNVTLIEAGHPWQLFNRGCIYGCQDDNVRFLYFSKSIFDYLFTQKRQPQILHIHDWQTAALAPLLRKKGGRTPKMLFTIHNLKYQGRCSPEELEKIGLEKEEYFTPENMQDSLFPEAANLLKGAIINADFVTTVSPTYAEEIKTPPFGEGLDPLIKNISSKFCGILNGIDYEYWNPETDPLLPGHFSSKEKIKKGEHKKTLSNKGLLKRKLRERLRLEEVHRPLIGTICRLVPQKGVEFFRHAMDSIVAMGGQFLILGTSPIPSIDAEFHALQYHFANHPHIAVTLQNQEDLAHLIYAGCDMLAAPSLFEPCGLTQMISLRYGTIPIVRATGGLCDSVYDVETSKKPIEETNGFVFQEATSAAFDSALYRAIRMWYDHPDTWKELVIRGMHWDFSWNNPAKEYLKIYQKI